MNTEKTFADIFQDMGGGFPVHAEFSFQVSE